MLRFLDSTDPRAREVIDMLNGRRIVQPLPTLDHVRFLVGIIEQLEIECSTMTELAIAHQRRGAAMSYLRATRVGVQVWCTVCRRTKQPIGRSAPLQASYCDDDCDGYRQPPRPGSLWPGESEAQFGYRVHSDGTNEATS